MTTTGKVQVKKCRKGQGFIQVKKPLTLDEGDLVSILINNKLIAVMTIDKRMCSLQYEQVLPQGYDKFVDWESPKYTIEDDISKVLKPRTEPCSGAGGDSSCVLYNVPKYDDMLKNIVFKDERNVDSTVTLPDITVEYPTRHRTDIINIGDVIKAIDLHGETPLDEGYINVTDLVEKWVKYEIRDDTARIVANKETGKPMLSLRSKRKKDDIKSIIAKLLRNVFRCPSCKSTCKTVITKKQGEKQYTRRCLVCPSVT